MKAALKPDLDHLRMGFVATLPLILGSFPFGVIFGALGIHSGLGVWGTVGMSLIVFAGSAQFVAVGLVAAGASLPLILVITFVVNLRHILYSAAVAPRYRAIPRGWKVLIAFGLTDESFAVVADRFRKSEAFAPHDLGYYLGSFLTMYISWNVWTVIGIVLGSSLPGIGEWGLDFAMSATFIGMIVPYLTTGPMILAALVSGTAALLGSALPYKLGLIVAAVLGLIAGSLLQSRRRKKLGAGA
jgi:4-azaleucine resistance transporter AzlC